jgi:hypothetical protein
VKLGEQTLGVTPLVAELPCGASTLQLHKPGYRALTREITPMADGLPISFTLERDSVEITIQSKPTGARIKVGDADAGRAPAKVSVMVGVPVVLSASKDGRVTSIKVTPTASSRPFLLDLKRGARSSRKAASSSSKSTLPDL